MDALANAERIVCWFSCGAASAVATKLAIEANARGPRLPLVVARCHIQEEHADNDRFADDCARWFGVPILDLADARFGASTYAVFEKELHRRAGRCALHPRPKEASTGSLPAAW